jgi:hypothetical protein
MYRLINKDFFTKPLLALAAILATIVFEYTGIVLVHALW